MRRIIPAALLSVVLAACGGSTYPSRSISTQQALTNSPEIVELEPPSARQELFREIARTSVSEAGQRNASAVLFPIIEGADFVAAPGFDGRVDLLQAPDAGEPLQLTFESHGGERWSDERRDVLQGLSEREAVELVARSLLNQWGIFPVGSVQVDRVSGAPYAAAYVDGILRMNPSFLYLAASAQPALNAAP